MTPGVIGQAAPGQYFPHGADGARGDPLANLPGILARMALDAHLGTYARFRRNLGKPARLVYGVSKRFLTIDMLAGPHRRHGNNGMGMVGRGDDHGVNVLLLLQHHAVVFIHSCVRILVKRFGGIVRIHVAQGHNVFRLHGAQIGSAHTAYANTGNIQFFTRRGVGRPAQHVTRYNVKYRGGGKRRTCAKENASIHFIHAVNP